MNKLAIIFAGQGSQYTNMGLDFVEKHLSLQEMEKTASSILGFDTKEVLASDDGRLNETICLPITYAIIIYLHTDNYHTLYHRCIFSLI